MGLAVKINNESRLGDMVTHAMFYIKGLFPISFVFTVI